MSHPPASWLTPADLVSEAGGRGFTVDRLSVPRLEEACGLGIGWSLRPRLDCEWSYFEVHTGSSPGDRVP